MTRRTDTSILASAMYALARDIHSADGIANAAIFEAAERLELQHFEIERLKAKFDPEKFAHRPDCCGPDIDTHCLGCAMAESNKGDMEVAALTIKIARLTGENSVLRDLLRDALEIVASEEDWTDRDWSEFANALAIRIIKAINGLGAWVSDGAEVSDGAIYETASRRAAPQAHDAALGNLLDGVQHDGYPRGVK